MLHISRMKIVQALKRSAAHIGHRHSTYWLRSNVLWLQTFRDKYWISDTCCYPFFFSQWISDTHTGCDPVTVVHAMHCVFVLAFSDDNT